MTLDVYGPTPEKLLLPENYHILHMCACMLTHNTTTEYTALGGNGTCHCCYKCLTTKFIRINTLGRGNITFLTNLGGGGGGEELRIHRSRKCRIESHHVQVTVDRVSKLVAITKL